MERQEVLAKFEPLLVQYAKDNGLPRICIGMGHVEAALRTLVVRGATEKYDDEIVMTAAAAVGQILTETSAITLGISSTDAADWDEFTTKFFQAAAQWQWKKQSILKKMLMSRAKFLEQTAAQLRGMFDKYFVPVESGTAEDVWVVGAES